MTHAALLRNMPGKPEAVDSTRLRFVTATSLFDGHDATINIIRRILQSQGAEVIHLGHNRSVREIVDTAVQEDADAIAVSSYQGGHVEFYQYLLDQLKAQGAQAIKVFGGGGGVITPAEIKQLHGYGIAHIFSPQEGQRLGLQGMITEMMRLCTDKRQVVLSPVTTVSDHSSVLNLARTLTQIQNGGYPAGKRRRLSEKVRSAKYKAAILGITGPGGAGKSSLSDELIRRFRSDYQDKLKIGIIAVDPSRKKTGGALLGDRIRMNAIDSDKIFMRSMATRDAETEIPQALAPCVAAMQAYGFDLIIVETPGIGQGDAGIAALADVSLYVMTSEFGAGTQLEKLSMLDFANLVAINKFDRKGSIDALHDVQKQLQRNREDFTQPPESMPVYGTIAAHMNDPGVTSLYQQLRRELIIVGLPEPPEKSAGFNSNGKQKTAIIPAARQRYLARIADSIKGYRHQAELQSGYARELQQLLATRDKLMDTKEVDGLIAEARRQFDPQSAHLLSEWLEKSKQVDAPDTDKPKPQSAFLNYSSISGLSIPKVALPGYHDHGDLLKWLLLENLPGAFPYTAGVFPFKRNDEEATRMFAGEGDAFRTNRRFKYLAAHSPANRLSTAFDSVTLYGCDPELRPDIFGKIGNSGVSIATLDDMKVLYDGFNLCDPNTSVSMTINGPAPIILAMFFNTAIDQQLARFQAEYKHLPDPEEQERISAETLCTIRGTVQADILKEDQGQNTCLFSTEFSMQLMGDIQEYFITRQIRHFYSISISGYHIAEAGADPITQLAFTLANGFTYVETFLARGMHIDDFAHRLSFFFSNGMDPEYTVIGRVARRIWAIALRQYYGAGERSQKLKYHIQTSGRSLHSQAIDFNEIRTTLQALIAIYDNCNSLHTNAKDEALTTPTEETVRHALAIQMIIDKEWGLAKNENPNQGAFIIEQLSDLVEAAVLREFENLSARGDVLGAMETAYQRGKIQEQSLRYEAGKHDGTLPIVGVNIAQSTQSGKKKKVVLARSSDQEKQSQIERLQQFKCRHRAKAENTLTQLKRSALAGENVFVQLMQAVRVCTLGQITQALFEVGGKYRRNM